jgi:hypothetical protein
VVARESTLREIGAIRSDVMGFRNIWGVGDWGRSVYGFTAGGDLIDIERNAPSYRGPQASRMRATSSAPSRNVRR